MTEELIAESRLSLKPVTRLLAHCSDEAPLYFANGATDIDQKRGLTLYGPADKSDLGPQTIRIGIVSSAEGTQQVTSWIQQFTERTIPATGLRPFIEQTFPGFLKAFNYISILKWGTGEFMPEQSDGRRGNDRFSSRPDFPLYSDTTFGRWNLSNYNGRGYFGIV